MAGAPRARAARQHLEEYGVGRICDAVAMGDNLWKIAKAVNAERLPKPLITPGQIYLWLMREKKRAELYEKAKFDAAQYFADEIVPIADLAGAPGPEGMDPRAAEVRVKARMWLAETLLRGKYRRASAMEITGKDGGPMESKVTLTVYIPDNGRDS